MKKTKLTGIFVLLCLGGLVFHACEKQQVETQQAKKPFQY